MKSKMAASMKTVVVLDHSPHFSSSSGVQFEIGISPTATNKLKYDKSLWTCCVESALEYARCVSDLFSGSDRPRAVRFVLSDFVGRHVTSIWPKLYAPETMLDYLAQLGAPDGTGDQESCAIVNGMSVAVEALAQATDLEKCQPPKPVATGSPTNDNEGSHGRIILFGSIKNMQDVEAIEQHVCEQIEVRNRWVKNQDVNYVVLQSVELCIINVHPVGSETEHLERARYRVNGRVSTEVRTCKAGAQLIQLTHALLLKHHDLTSTTVTGIPMKEETNVGTSTNYDVELLHERRAHINLMKAGLLQSAVDSADDLIDSYRTVSLCWCTPNSKNQEQNAKPPTCATFRVTPAAVNSRPSACLTQFLLSGKNVHLEVSAALRQQARLIQANLNNKLISHMLSCTAGVIYVHSFTFGKCAADDPPSISAGVGGRVFDYRMAHFASLMHETHLQPPEHLHQVSPLNIRAFANLNAITRFWPLVFSDSIIFSLAQKFEPLVSIVRKTSLTATELDTCIHKVLAFQQMQINNEPLIMSGNTCPKLKGQRNRSEQYQQMFLELEQYLSNYAGRSTDHNKVFNCLYTCMGKDKQKYVNLFEDLNPSNMFQLTASIKPEGTGAASVTSSTSSTVSRDPRKRKHNEMDIKQEPGVSSSTSSEGVKTSFVKLKPGESVNVYQLFLTEYNKRWANWRDFDARVINGDKPVQLYGWMHMDDNKTNKHSVQPATSR